MQEIGQRALSALPGVKGEKYVKNEALLKVGDEFTFQFSGVNENEGTKEKIKDV